MRSRSGLAVVALAWAMAACSDATSPTDELTAARRRWDAWGPASYDLVVQRGPCECLPAAMEKIVVAVRDGVISRYHLDDKQPVVESFLQYPAVPGLFDYIQERIAAGSTVEVEYDAMTGAPLRIVIDPQDMPVDGGYLLEIILRPPADV